MLSFQKYRELVKKGFTPITIMLIPHSKTKPFNFKVPFVFIVTFVILCFFGMASVCSMVVKTVDYYQMKDQVGYYAEQFADMKSTIVSLKKDEVEFKRLFALESGKDVLENMDVSDRGSIDLESLKLDIKKTIETVGEIKDYLHEQRNIHLSTPQGRPVEGYVSSFFGMRIKPGYKHKEFHSGIDIAAPPGTPVKATADGIVSFSGPSGPNGNLVVLEHGRGFSTFYAHNRKNLVKVGQKVKRGEVIGHVGSTGNSTGPHVHYEIWKYGQAVNPAKYFKERS
ncbi:MAG: M23 family metallopeptidase [Syntrophaceae bacterium]|nr:M23 family metallopeptidase [Syntrophaceae bacterium]